MASTPIVSGQKTSFIALANTLDPQEATRLNVVLVNYSDIPNAIGMFVRYPNFLTQGMAIFSPNDSDLVAAGIYVGKSLTSTTNNPVMIINTTSTGRIQMVANQYELYILGSSNVSNITVSTTITLSILYEGAGSLVDIVDSTATGALIGNIFLDYQHSLGSTLNSVVYGSNVTTVTVQSGSQYGGVRNTDPEATCATPVTNLATGIVTHNTFELTWTPPSPGFLLINVYYRLKDASQWVVALAIDGDYVGNTGFIFRHLKSDTFYDFRVNVSCANGGISTDAIINQQTNSSTVITAGGQR